MPTVTYVYDTSYTPLIFHIHLERQIWTTLPGDAFLWSWFRSHFSGVAIVRFFLNNVVRVEIFTMQGAAIRWNLNRIVTDGTAHSPGGSIKNL